MGVMERRVRARKPEPLTARITFACTEAEKIEFERAVQESARRARFFREKMRRFLRDRR
jgi:hypothetical protein